MTNTAHEPQTAQELVAERIKVLAWRARVSQAKLGRAVGLSQPAMSQKLCGRVVITVPELYAIAGVLGVDVSDLLPRLDSNQQPCGYPSLQVSDVVELAPWRDRQLRRRSSSSPRRPLYAVEARRDAAGSSC